MSLSQLEEVHAIIKTRPHFGSALAVRRDAWEALAARFPTPDDVEITPVRLNSVRALWVVPPGIADKRVILFFHGGGFVLGSPESHQEVLSRLARSAGARVLTIDHRLAPEHPFPSGIHDCVEGYEWLLKAGYRSDQICFAGDSSGGNFVISAMLLARERGLPLPACAVCWSAWFDLTNASPSITTNAGKDVFVPAGFTDPASKIYLAGADPRDPLASPIFGDLKGLPPLLIQVGDVELLVDDSRRFRYAAAAAGVDVTLEIWPSMCHIWQFFGQVLDEGVEATERSGQFIKRHLK